MALPPSVFTTVCEKLKNVYPPEESKGKLRIIIEKPFGRDLDTYREMQKKFPHYLLKMKFIELIII